MKNDLPIRENIEWCEIWIPDSVHAQLDKPRVLLVGDSITVGYGQMVQEQLGEMASVGRIGTSRFVADPVFRQEILMVLGHTKFDIIHFNHGLHGFDNGDESYAECLPAALAFFRAAAPEASWILATSTPMRVRGRLEQWHPHHPRILFRNEVIRQLAADDGLPVTELFACVEDHPEYYDPDATHFNEVGRKAQAALVAESVRRVIESRSKSTANP